MQIFYVYYDLFHKIIPAIRIHLIFLHVGIVIVAPQPKKYKGRKKKIYNLCDMLLSFCLFQLFTFKTSYLIPKYY